MLPVHRKRLLVGAGLLILSLIGTYFLWPKNEIVSIDEVFPGKPWAKPLPILPPLKGVGDVRAENCGNCHKEIYEEWKTSTHANALSDLQFQSELSKPSSPKWLCLNCHTPVSNQRETLVQFLKNGDYKTPVEEPNPYFDPKMKDEAITCAVCHVRLDEKGESYVIGANGKTKPPHPVKIQPDLLKNRCLDCHNANYVLDDQLVCAFKTGFEGEQNGNAHGKIACGSCHMPTIQRKIVKQELGTPLRTSHKHAFIGGGIPKRFDLYPKQIPGGYTTGLQIQNLVWKRQTKKDLEYSVIFTNLNAAHNIPTGDPERFILIRSSLLDSLGNVLDSKETKYGQEWEWWPKAKLISDTRILPGETRTWKEKFSTDNLSARRIRLEFYQIRLKESNAAYMRKIEGNLDPHLQEKIAKIENFYPFSSLIHREEVDLKSGITKRLSPAELMQYSSARKGE